MKKPRLTDFDPNAKMPKLGSPLDNMPIIQRPPESPILVDKNNSKQEENKDHEEQKEKEYQTKERTSVSPPARTPVRRTTTRYAFEFFQDQIESLREFSLDEKLRGEKGSMSEMVREALDAYIAKRRRLEE